MSDAQALLIGPPPPSAAGAGAAYEHAQVAPASTWIITHGLGYRPNVTIVDATGDVVDTDVAYSSVNALTLTFASPTSGVAYLS